MSVLSVFAAGPDRVAAPIDYSKVGTLPSIGSAGVAVAIDKVHVRSRELLAVLIDELIVCIENDKRLADLIA